MTKKEVFSNRPGVVYEGHESKDVLYELTHVKEGSSWRTVYVAEYHARGNVVEVFIADKQVDAERHFFGVSEGTVAPIPDLYVYQETIYPAEQLADEATLDLFDAKESL
jgi:hypothetical protein